MQTAIIGGILGFGMLAYWWMRMRQAEDDKARADAGQGFIRSEAEAKQAEQAAKLAADAARTAVQNGEKKSDEW